MFCLPRPGNRLLVHSTTLPHIIFRLHLWNHPFHCIGLIYPTENKKLSTIKSGAIAGQRVVPVSQRTHRIDYLYDTEISTQAVGPFAGVCLSSFLGKSGTILEAIKSRAFLDGKRKTRFII